MATASGHSRAHGQVVRSRAVHHAGFSHAGSSHSRARGYRAISYSQMVRDSAVATTDPSGALAPAGIGYDTGMVTWYGGRSLTGHRTASGEVLTGKELTAAHLSLPFNTRLRITNLNNGRSVVVRINDRGPFSHIYKLDLSEAAADAINIRHSGQGMVRMDIVQDQPQYAQVPGAAVQTVSGTYACASGRPTVSKTGGSSCP